MSVSTLFTNLSNHLCTNLNFSEPFLNDGLLWQLAHLDFNESGLKVKRILESVYLDGITGLEGVKVEGQNIVGVFLDYVSPTLTRKFNFIITSNDVSYQMVNTESESQFIEYLEFVKGSTPKVTKTGAKSKATKTGRVRQCTEGKSYPCGATCLSVSKKCRQSLAEDLKKEQQEVIDAFMSLSGAESAVTQKSANMTSVETRKRTTKMAKASDEKQVDNKINVEPKASDEKQIDNQVEDKAKTPTKKTKNITQEFGEDWGKTWNKAPDDLSQVLRLVVTPKQIVGRNDGLDLTDKVAFYDPNETALFMSNLDPTSLLGSSAYRHEYGHHIDHQIGKANSVKNGISTTSEVNSKFRSDEKRLVERESEAHKKNRAEFEDLENYKNAPSIKRLLNKTPLSTQDKDVIGTEIKRLKLIESVVNDVKSKGITDVDLKVGESLKILTKQIEEGGLTESRTYKNIQGIPDSKERVALLFKYLASPDSVSVEFESSEKFLESRGVGAKGVIADLIGSMTRNKIGYGHSEDYYKQGTHLQNSETFANLVSIYGSGDSEAIAILDSLVPESLTVMKQVFKNYKSKKK